ncbi:MAG: hypothetical protein WC369_06635 [Dehalococcoidales bacterium]|jgi:hypothetical protein
MGSRDYRKKETKKPKKDGGKISVDGVVVQSAETEVIRKPHKGRREGEEA